MAHLTIGHFNNNSQNTAILTEIPRITQHLISYRWWLAVSRDSTMKHCGIPFNISYRKYFS